MNPGTAVTLSATVMVGSNPLTTGQVNFCDATATACSDIHLIGTAQLNSNGTAALKFIPGPGQYSYKAVFQPSSTGTKSSSSAVALTVNATASTPYQTTTTIAQSGAAGNYTLTAKVTETGASPPITGSISFLDTSYSNGVVATAALTSVPGLTLRQTASPTTYFRPMLITGDFNFDGFVDIAAASTYATAIQLFLGNGDGTFTTATSLTPAMVPTGITVGDFNGDGKLDIATTSANTASGLMQVFLGNGDGTFTTAPGSVPVSSTNSVFATADFNSDGKLDLIMNAGTSVNILLGNGDGTFTQGPPPGTSTTAQSPLLAVGDVNGDGLADLITGGNNAVAIQVYLGNGDGTFRGAGQTLPFTQTQGPIAATVGDFNGDGILDFSAIGGSAGIPVVFLGVGDGTFNQAASSPNVVGTNQPKSLSVTDFNHDGYLDLVITNINSSNGNSNNPDLMILFGKGDGTFSSSVADTQLFQTVQAIPADVNNDGQPDLIVGTTTLMSALKTTLTQTATAIATGVSLSGPAPHMVDASYPGDSNYSSSLSSTTSLNAQVAAPQFSPASGTYTGLASFTISDATPGAVIGANFVDTFFNGLGQTSGPANLTIPIYSSGTFTLQAQATETGYQNSDYVTATYTVILPQAPAPVFSLAPGYYPGTQTLTITDAQPGVTIFFAIDGRAAGIGSTVYSGPITISNSVTVSAIAAGGGYSISPTISAQYYIGSVAAAYIYTIAGNGIPGFTSDGNPAVQANLSSPYTSAMDSAGNMYVSENGNNLVRKIAAGTGIITTVAGNGIAGYSGDNGPATSAALNHPQAVAVDSAGNLYILDFLNQVVRKVTASTGIITTFAGSPTATTLGDGGSATSAQLAALEGLAVDSAGNLYIGTSGRVRKVDATLGTITTFAGNGGFVSPPNLNSITIGGPPPAPLNIGDGKAATSATIDNPYGIAFDAAGNAYISDITLNVVRKVAVGTGIITTVAGTTMGINSFSPYPAEGVAATITRLNSPIALAVDGAGDLFIAEQGTHTIREVTAGTGIINTVAGLPIIAPLPGFTFSCPTTSGGDGSIATQAALCSPQSITLDSTGNLYIAQPAQHRIRKVVVASPSPTTPAATPAFSVAAGTYGSPQTVMITDATPGAEIYVTLTGASATTAQLAQYRNPIMVDGSVTIGAIAVAPGYVPSTAAAAAYTITSLPARRITTVAGTGTAGTSGSGGLALNQQLSTTANGVATDQNGNVYVADSGAQVVWKIANGTGAISIAAGILGAPGQPVSGVAATSTPLYNPTHVAIDGAGNLYIADSTNAIVRKVSAQTGFITTVAGGGTGTLVSGDGGPATSAYLSGPQGIALDASGNLYIADQNHNIVRKVDASTGIITTVVGTYGMKSPGIATNQGFEGDGGPATSAKLYGPSDLRLDSKGNLYVIDGVNQRVRMIAAGTGTITTVAGDGGSGQTGDGKPATSAEIAPRGIALDAADNLYIANGPNTIRMVPAGGGTITTVVGSGFTGFSGDGGSAKVAELSSPTGLAFDATGNLFFTDQSNYRLREVLTTPTPSITWTAPTAITYGTALSSTQLNATASVPGSFTYSPAAGTVLGVGTQNLSVAFTPTASTTYLPATKTVSLVVNPAALNISANNATRVFGTANPTFTGSVSGAVNGDTFTETFSTTAVLASPVGSYAIVPAVSGSNSANYTIVPTNGALTVSKAGTSTALALSNQNLTLTATVTSATSGTPTGTVAFYQGSTQVGTGTLSNGVASYTMSSLPAGSVTLSAQYSGDTNFTSSSTTPVVLVAVAPVSTSLTIAAGGSVSDVLNLSVPAGYTGTIQFSCTDLPVGVTCTFVPPSVTFTGTGTTASTTLTIQTTARASLVTPSTNGPALAAVFGIPGLLALVSLRRRRSFRLRLLALVLVLCSLSAGITACGGGSSSGGGTSGGGTTTGTPSGSSTIKVVAAGSGGFSQTVSLTLTVP